MRRPVFIACAGGIAAIGLGVVATLPSASSSQPESSVRPAVRHASAQPAATRSARPAVAEAAAVNPTPAVGLPPSYRILLARSIFTGGPVVVAPGHSASPTAILALRGIMQQGRGFIAFVENTNSREAQQVRVGDTVGPGKIVDIDLHAVKYATGGRSLRVAVGQTFDGGSSNALNSDPATGALATVRPVAE